jgi:DNA-binding winged helix-turn-helix (wHTH) protein
MIVFPPYRLDLRTERLWRYDEHVTLRPKTWAVLRHLVERPFVVVGKDELVAAVWGVSAVSDDALTRTIGELRQALRDDARTPAIIQTVHGRGFRFIAPLWHETDAQGGRSADGVPLDVPLFVGRESELATLEEHFRAAASGRRQIVFIPSEAGAGTSALISRFVTWVRASQPDVPIGCAQAVEQFGLREPFLPPLLALARLVRGVRYEALVAALGATAPSWLAQLPSDADLRDDVRIPSTVSPKRMLREFANFVDAAAADTPLVIALEDLHWSDFGTVDLVKTIARRPDPARLLLIASYHSPQAAAVGHPIAHAAATLEARQLSTLLPLKGLTRAAIAEYLAHRLAPWPVDDNVTELLAEHTRGNPLFMVALVNHFVATGRLVQQPRWAFIVPQHQVVADVPRDLARMLERQLTLTTPEERALLDVASVAGTTFDVREVAACLDLAEDEIERRCDRLCYAHELISPDGSALWPEGSTGRRYAFVHAPYQRVLYEAMVPIRRETLHQRIGIRLERGYGSRTIEVATELASHFQQSGDRARAARYLGECADRAYARRAYRDTVAFIERALPLLGELPTSEEAQRQELHLRQMYTIVLAYTEGYASERLLENLTRARTLCAWHTDSSALFDVLYALATLHVARGDLKAAATIGEDLIALSAKGAVAGSWRANLLQGVVAFWTGALATAERQMALVRTLSMSLPRNLPWFGVDPVVFASSYENWRLWVCGQPERGLQRQQETIGLAETLNHPFTTAQALTFGAAIRALSGQWEEAHRLADRAVGLAGEYGFPRWSGIGQVCRGRALVGLGDRSAGVQGLREGLDVLQRNNERFGSSLLFVLQADAFRELGEMAEGLLAVERGVTLCQQTGERVFEGELLRLKGELLAAAHPSGEGDAEIDVCFTAALSLARQMGAATLEQRAQASMARVTGTRSLASRERAETG